MDKIQSLELEILNLKRQLAKTELELRELKCSQHEIAEPSLLQNFQPSDPPALSNEDIARYSRQIIVPQVGVAGQLKLKESSVLIVGAGGLGCPAALYIVTAGVGKVGIIDYDTVEINNLHRQILHTEATIGMNKAESAKLALSKMNKECNIVTYTCQLNSENALETIRQYTIVLDCTDNVATRYLLNDACVITNKALVSGSALQMEGQLIVYNFKGGPCYRCLFPTPPPPAAVTNCGDGGVLGAVTGVVGSLQANEAIKVLIGLPDVLNDRMMIFDGGLGRFKAVRLRSKRNNCDVCSNKPIITHLMDYELFCGMRASDKDFALTLLEESERLTVQDYYKMVQTNTPHVLIDVRPPIEFDICHLPNSVNIPLKQIIEDKKLEEIKEKVLSNKLPVIFVCRRGNDSQIAAQHLQGKLQGFAEIKDIIGGLHGWHFRIDKNFPIY